MLLSVNNGGDGGKVTKLRVGKGKSRRSFAGELCVTPLVCHATAIT